MGVPLHEFQSDTPANAASSWCFSTPEIVVVYNGPYFPWHQRWNSKVEFTHMLLCSFPPPNAGCDTDITAQSLFAHHTDVRSLSLTLIQGLLTQRGSWLHHDTQWRVHTVSANLSEYFWLDLILNSSRPDVLFSVIDKNHLVSVSEQSSSTNALCGSFRRWS